MTLPPDSCGGRSIHAFSDSESDGPGSGLDDSDGSEKKGTATVKVAKRSNSSFQRIEALLSSKDNFLSRGFSWRQGSSNSGGSSKNLNSSTMTNALATSTGALLLSPASPSHDSMADATATILQPSSPGRATSPPALTSSYNAASSNSASLSGLAASVGSLLLGRSLGGSEAGNNDVGKQASSSSLNGSRGGGGGSVTGGAAVALSASSRVLVEEEEEQEEEQEQGKGKLLALVEDAAFAFPVCEQHARTQTLP